MYPIQSIDSFRETIPTGRIHAVVSCVLANVRGMIVWTPKLQAEDDCRGQRKCSEGTHVLSVN